MTFFTELNSRVAALSGLLPGGVTVETLGSVVQGLDDTQVVALAEFATQGRQLFEQVMLATSAVISERSTRTAGHAGLAQSRGFRTPAAFIQQFTGVSRSTALQQIRVGEALLEQEPVVTLNTEVDSEGVPVETPVLQKLWHAPLKNALIEGTLSSAQHDAIKRGLGEPPNADGADNTDALSHAAGAFGADATTLPLDPATVEAWALAAEQLVTYAAEVPVEELAKQARALRDLLDPVGAEVRFLARYEQRSFRMWIDSDGVTHGKFVFDDESAEWIRTIIDTALRPRRGGPRFVTADEQARAAELKRDSRTNEQLTHDLLIDVLQAGSVADAETVFGVRQAGIKLVQVVNRDDYLAGAYSTGTRSPATRFQESGTILPKGVAEKQRCNTGVQPVIVDQTGDPLQVGREQRLFTTKQRVALAVRDGGCRWTGCERPASYCEAHHIDAWEADQGRTDIDRGVLLCAFHHLQLHNNGWKITRQGRGAFLLHPPPGKSLQKSGPGVEGTGVPRMTGPGGHAPPETTEQSGQAAQREQTAPVELRPPLPLTYAWQLAQTPTKRFRVAA